MDTFEQDKALSQSFVRKIELNSKQPTVESLEYLCGALRITVKDFIKVLEK